MSVAERIEATGSWTPPPRPDWVERVNAEGRNLDIASIVPFDAENLVATAMRSTGLSDFGTDDWREPLDLLAKALDEEAGLNLIGRIMTRSELVDILEARLQIEDTYKRHPEIDEEVIAAPLIITGAARTGTTALYNLLAADPDNRAPLLWEVRYPYPPPEAATYDTDPRIRQVDEIIGMWDRVTPEFPLVHEQRAHLPVEDNYLLMFSLRGPNAWQGKTPSYVQWLSGADLTPAFDYAKRVLKYLQFRNRRKRWVLKSPGLTVPLPALFEAFPDAMLVHTHRDPAKLTVSSRHLLNTVFWVRSDDHRAHEDFYKVITNDEVVAGALNANIALMEDGTVPKDQVFNLLYQDFIDDNVGAVRRIYEHFELESGDASFPAMTRWAEQDAQARRSAPSYRYADPSPEEVALREIYGTYQRYFAIPDEIGS